MLEYLFGIEDFYPKIKFDITKPQTIQKRYLSNNKAKDLINFNILNDIKLG